MRQSQKNSGHPFHQSYNTINSSPEENLEISNNGYSSMPMRTMRCLSTRRRASKPARLSLAVGTLLLGGVSLANDLAVPPECQNESWWSWLASEEPKKSREQCLEEKLHSEQKQINTLYISERVLDSEYRTGLRDLSKRFEGPSALDLIGGQTGSAIDRAQGKASPINRDRSEQTPLSGYQTLSDQ